MHSTGLLHAIHNSLDHPSCLLVGEQLGQHVAGERQPARNQAALEHRVQLALQRRSGAHIRNPQSGGHQGRVHRAQAPQQALPSPPPAVAGCRRRPWHRRSCAPLAAAAASAAAACHRSGSRPETGGTKMSRRSCLLPVANGRRDHSTRIGLQQLKRSDAQEEDACQFMRPAGVGPRCRGAY